MNKKEFSGDYVNAFLSETKFTENKVSKLLDSKIEIQENEASYVYSFKESKLLFVKGFNKLLGLKHSELNIKVLHTIWEDNIIEFFKEFHDRILLYFHNNNNNIKSIGCNSIVKLKNIDTLVNHSVRVYETDENGNLESIIVRLKLDESLKSTDIIQYALTGIIHEKSLKETKYNLDYKKCISRREIEIIESLIDTNKSGSILSQVLLNQEELASVQENLIVRFGLNSKEELIQFAKDNSFVPNQFNHIV